MLNVCQAVAIAMAREDHEDRMEVLVVSLEIVKIEFALVQQGLRPPWMMPN